MLKNALNTTMSLMFIPPLALRSNRCEQAVWPTDEKFDRVQQLMAANGRENHNGSRPVRHVDVFNSDLLHCGRCGTSLEGRSGTGRLGVTSFFYYVCKNKGCGLRVAAEEIEGAVLSRIQQLATEDRLLELIMAETDRGSPARSPRCWQGVVHWRKG